MDCETGDWGLRTEDNLFLVWFDLVFYFEIKRELNDWLDNHRIGHVIKPVGIQSIEVECAALPRALNRVFLPIIIAADLF